MWHDCESSNSGSIHEQLLVVQRSGMWDQNYDRWKLQCCWEGSDARTADFEYFAHVRLSACKRNTLTRRSDMGVLSLAGRCCSRAKTMQLAIIVARIMYSNGVWELRSNCNSIEYSKKKRNWIRMAKEGRQTDRQTINCTLCMWSRSFQMVDHSQPFSVGHCLWVRAYGAYDSWHYSHDDETQILWLYFSYCDFWDRDLTTLITTLVFQVNCIILSFIDGLTTKYNQQRTFEAMLPNGYLTLV